MGKPHTNLRPLLIQIRETDEIASHERLCYLTRCGFDPDRFEWINVVNQPAVRWADADHADVIFIGGAGMYSVTKAYEFTNPLHDLVCEAVKRDRPLFGNCWGHQFIAQALGGSVVTDMSTSEVGCFDIVLADNAEDDPVLGGLSGRFPALMGHHDRIDIMPECCIELAYSDRCRNQALRVKDKPIYGTQFHTEMNGEQLIDRLTVYCASYLDSEDDLEALKQRDLATPDVDQILQNFLETYV